MNDPDFKPDWTQWSSVSFYDLSFWWRLKLLFKPHPLVFCWGEDHWFTDGFLGEQRLYVNAVPNYLQNKIEKL